MKLTYQLCDTCNHLLTALYFNNSTTCDICTRESNKKMENK